MMQDKHGKQHSTENGTSLKGLAQMLRGCSPDNNVLTKRQESNLTLGNLQEKSLNPIKKKLKVEAGLQEGYEVGISVAEAQAPNATLAKQEESGPSPNCKLEGSQSQFSDKEHCMKPESNQSHSKKEPDQINHSEDLFPESDASFSPVNPQNLCYVQEFTR